MPSLTCTLLCLLAVIALAVQLLYLLFLETALQRPPRGLRNGPETPVSVLVCARNEAGNLRRRLPALLEQDWKNYEVLLLDDDSQDETQSVITELQQRFRNLRCRKIQPDEKTAPGKKGALLIGVPEARHEVLIFTDADCIPASPYWIEKMTAALTAEKEIVIGYGPYEPRPGFLNAFIRAETLLSFLQVKAFHRLGIHYMAVGRNLCVRKNTFLRAAAHPLWIRTLSGDDDMLVRICATPHNTAVVADPETYVYSPARPDRPAYIRQKQRHLSTGKYYRLPVKILLAGISGTHALSWLLLPFVAACVFMQGTLLSFLALGLFLVRLLFFAGLFAKQARRHHGLFTPLFPLAFDAAFAGYPLFFAPYIFWKNKDRWN